MITVTDLLRHPAAQRSGPTVADDSPLMTVRELARYLHMPVSTAYMVIEQGRVQQVVRFGRSVRVRRDEAERLAREGIPTLTRAVRPTRAQMRR